MYQTPGGGPRALEVNPGPWRRTQGPGREPIPLEADPKIQALGSPQKSPNDVPIEIQMKMNKMFPSCVQFLKRRVSQGFAMITIEFTWGLHKV